VVETNHPNFTLIIICGGLTPFYFWEFLFSFGFSFVFFSVHALGFIALTFLGSLME